ncbi:MAG: competence protein [Clostridium butyricum]|nr:competence protein [Clostridium butyricum]
MDNVTNYMEIWVREYMDELLEQSNCCSCEKCKRDIFALALNNLKPYYVTTDKGRVMAKLANAENQFETDIFIEITKAINKVQENPSHD